MKKRLVLPAALSVALLAVGCDTTDSPQDSGMVADAGQDAGADDTGVVDMGVADAGVMDAEVEDTPVV